MQKTDSDWAPYRAEVARATNALLPHYSLHKIITDIDAVSGCETGCTPTVTTLTQEQFINMGGSPDYDLSMRAGGPEYMDKEPYPDHESLCLVPIFSDYPDNKKKWDACFQRLGVLAQTVDPSIFDEVFKLACDMDVVIYIGSDRIGINTSIKIRDNGYWLRETVMAHYSYAGKDQYLKIPMTVKDQPPYKYQGTYLRPVYPGEGPCPYYGYFRFREFAHLFQVNKTKAEYKRFEDFLL